MCTRKFIDLGGFILFVLLFISTFNVSGKAKNPQGLQNEREANLSTVGYSGFEPVAVDSNGDEGTAEGPVQMFIPLVQGGNLRVYSHNMDYIGHIGGRTTSLTTVGDYAYMGEGASLTILDVSQPDAPEVISRSPMLSGIVNEVLIQTNYAYVAVETPRVFHQDLWMIDISNPANQNLISFYNLPGGTSDFAVAEGYVYVAAWSGMRIIDVTDPFVPFEVGFFETESYDVSISVTGDYAYLVTEEILDKGETYVYTMVVIDISDPANPIEIDRYILPNYVSTSTVNGDDAYVDDWDGLSLMDVSETANSLEADAYQIFEVAADVTVAEGYAYVAGGGDGLWVIDVNDPGFPVVSGSYDTPGNAVDVEVAGDYAYVADGDYGLRVLDISDPAHPFEVSYFETDYFAREVVVSGIYAYLLEGYISLQILDISDPANPLQVGYYGDDYILGIAVLGNYAYLSVAGSLIVLDVSDPVDPIQVGSYQSPSAHMEIAVVGDYAYMGEYEGLRVFDVSDPANIIEISYFGTPGRVAKVAVSEGYAYLGEFQTIDSLSINLRVINISNPANLFEVGYFNAYDSPSGMDVSGSFAIVASGANGLIILKYTGIKDISYTAITTDNPDPSLAGESFTVTYQVNTDFGIPSGAVTITVEGESASCTGELLGKTGSCGITLDITGTYTLTATYNGDQYFLPSSVSVTHTVIQAEYTPLVTPDD